MLQMPSTISFLQFYSAAQEVVEQSPHCVGGRIAGAFVNLQDNEVCASFAAHSCLMRSSILCIQMGSCCLTAHLYYGVVCLLLMLEWWATG